jgi:hypothetical protein
VGAAAVHLIGSLSLTVLAIASVNALVAGN